LSQPVSQRSENTSHFTSLESLSAPILSIFYVFMAAVCSPKSVCIPDSNARPAVSPLAPEAFPAATGAVVMMITLLKKTRSGNLLRRVQSLIHNPEAAEPLPFVPVRTRLRLGFTLPADAQSSSARCTPVKASGNFSQIKKRSRTREKNADPATEAES
jgi:hypothetical protein